MLLQHPAPPGRPRLRVLPVLIGLFVGLPLLDMVLVIWLGTRLGLLQTVALVVVSGIVGAWLARQQGAAVVRSIQRDLMEGRVPSQGLLDGVMVLVAGGMLMAPGFLTDVLGLGLLLPPVRAPIKAWLRRKFERAFAGATVIEIE